MAIDKKGYRPNVGIILRNKTGQILWAKRKDQNSWQFPQGGIDAGETETDAMYRELYEEIGVTKEHIKIIAISKNWLHYRLPRRFLNAQKNLDSRSFVGQKQKWFFMQLEADDSFINLNATNKPEFDNWKWVSYWYPLRYIIFFKKEVYKKALKEFSIFNTDKEL